MFGYRLGQFCTALALSGVSLSLSLSLGSKNVWADIAGQISIHPAEARLFADVSDGNIDGQSTLEAGLIAVGFSDHAQRAHYLDQWEALLQETLELPGGRRDPEALFDWLHRRVLRGGYARESDSPVETLRAGRFNCLSASWLYLDLCRRHGHAARPVATDGHVRIRLLAKPRRDIETTCPQWNHACIEIPSPSDAKWQPLNDAQWLGKTYFNRATRSLHQRQWQTAIQWANVACRLDPSDRAAAENRLAALNNWALEACDCGDFTTGLRLIRQGLDLAPDYQPLLASYRYIQHKRDVTETRVGGSRAVSVEHTDSLTGS